ETMNEFLQKNKDLFPSKREFLTKLREVRQKIMNNNEATMSKKDSTNPDDNTNINNNSNILMASL
ncbi:unnamed protein product, partial [Brachionus calyciflorus]